MTRPDEVVKDQPVEVLAAALIEVDGLRFQHDPDAPMRTTATAILRLLTDSGYRLIAEADLERLKRIEAAARSMAALSSTDDRIVIWRRLRALRAALTESSQSGEER